jgi:hypothetical protein
MSLLLLAELMYLAQLCHSFEELTHGFHKKWYLFKMPFWVFLTFEILFNLFWAVVIFSNVLANKETLLVVWIALMTLNGMQHVVWSVVLKKYVPGLYTAPLHLVLIALYGLMNILK